MRRIAGIGTLGLAAGLAVTGGRGLVQGQGSPGHSVFGADTYRTYCAVCHGEKGKGDGPLAESLRFQPPDLTVIAKRNDGEYPAKKVARIVDGRDPLEGHGGPDMPVWGDAFKNTETGFDDEKVRQKIQGVVDYVGRLQEK